MFGTNLAFPEGLARVLAFRVGLSIAVKHHDASFIVFTESIFFPFECGRRNMQLQ